MEDFIENYFLPLFQVYSHPLTTALSSMVCEHPMSTSVHVSETPWGNVQRQPSFHCVCNKIMWLGPPHGLGSPVLVDTHPHVCPLQGLRATSRPPALSPGPVEGMAWGVRADRCGLEVRELQLFWLGKGHSVQKTTLWRSDPFVSWLWAIPNSVMSKEMCLSLPSPACTNFHSRPPP